MDDRLLIVGFRRAAVADAIDRRRAAAPRAAVARLRAEIEALGAGSWKAVSRSAQLVESWEELLGLASGAAPGDVVSRGVLAHDGQSWVFRGNGSAPGWIAEEMIPAAREMSRSLRLGATRDDPR